MQKTTVNSWNEWDPLRHVIVGRADNCHIPPEEPALDAKVPEDSDMRGQWGPRPQDTIDRANELLDTFAKQLETRGIRVDRPTPIDHALPATTPDFHTDSQFGCMPPRDVLLTVGSEILEATMSYRCRWFEYLNYRPLMQRYWEDDPNFRHEAAPKPRLTDADYHPDYLSDKIGVEKRLQWAAEKFFVTTEEEPLFDAAGDPYPIHIDATFTPLRPGLILNNPQRRLPDDQRDMFEKNGWDIVDAAQPAHNAPPPLCYSSVWLSMNVLVLDPKTVCVEKSEVYQAEQMDKLGMEVVEVELRDAYAFGGGLHCCTADVYRDGTCEDYFPNL